MNSKLIEQLQSELRANSMDYMMTDRDKHFQDCKYKFIADMYEANKSIKILNETRHWIRAYVGTQFVGLVPKGDSRFNAKGQYVGDSDL